MFVGAGTSEIVGLETQERVDIVVWNPKYEGQASRLKTEAEVDAQS